jgi:hypothetical protein
MNNIKTHVANFLGKCKNCNHWTGAGLDAEDNEICEISKLECPIWGIELGKEYLTPKVKSKKIWNKLAKQVLEENRGAWEELGKEEKK